MRVVRLEFPTLPEQLQRKPLAKNEDELFDSSSFFNYELPGNELVRS